MSTFTNTANRKTADVCQTNYLLPVNTNAFSIYIVPPFWGSQCTCKYCDGILSLLHSRKQISPQKIEFIPWHLLREVSGVGRMEGGDVQCSTPGVSKPQRKLEQWSLLLCTFYGVFEPLDPVALSPDFFALKASLWAGLFGAEEETLCDTQRSCRLAYPPTVLS